MSNKTYFLANLFVFLMLVFILKILPIYLEKAPLFTSVKLEPQTFDFGAVSFGKPVFTKLYLYNIDKHNLVIEKIEKDCHCISSALTNQKIASGDSISIKIGYDASQEGFFQHVISIKMNIKETYKTIIVKGNVLSNLNVVVPSRAKF